MGNKLTFEMRVEDAKDYVEKGELKKAISTLKKAIENDPDKDTDDNIKTLIGELEVELEQVEIEEVKVEEEVDEVIPGIPDEDELDPNEIIEFIVTSPFLKGAVAYEVGNKIKLPRKNDFIHVKEV